MNIVFVAKVNWTLLQWVFGHYCKNWEEVRNAFYSSQKPSFTGFGGVAPKSTLQLCPLSQFCNFVQKVLAKNKYRLSQ